MLTKLMLLSKIRKFYRIFKDDLDIIQDKIKYTELNDNIVLLSIQYDIVQALDAYDGCFCDAYALDTWLKKIDRDITKLLTKHNYF